MEQESVLYRDTSLRIGLHRKCAGGPWSQLDRRIDGKRLTTETVVATVTSHRVTLNQEKTFVVRGSWFVISGSEKKTRATGSGLTTHDCINAGAHQKLKHVTAS